MSTFEYVNTNAVGDPPYATFKFDSNTTPTTVTFHNKDADDNTFFPLDAQYTYTDDPTTKVILDIHSRSRALVGTFLLTLASKLVSGSTTRYNVVDYIVNNNSSSIITPGLYYTISLRFIREPRRLNHVKFVGVLGDFTSLSDAITWFNTTATDNTTFELDSDIFLITDTLIINAGDLALTIVGKGSNNTHLNAATGLAGKPMFNIRSRCDIHSLSVDGSTLASYGRTGVVENFVTFNTTPTTTDGSLYCEFVDLIVYGFSVGFRDTIGVSIFVFNFIVDTCLIGVQVNYTTIGAGETTIDCEVGNFVNCPVGVSLAKAELASFILAHLVFYNSLSTNIGVLYDGTNYTYGTSSVLLNSSFNHIGMFNSGFNFAIQRDANIEIVGNVGVEDASPYAKVNVTNNGFGTSETTAGTYYKAVFTNGTTFGVKIGFANNRMTFLSSHPRSMKHWISGNLSTSGATRTIDVAIRRELALTSLTVSGSVVTGTSASAHNLGVGDQIQVLGIIGGTTSWNGVKTIASVPTTTTFTYASTGSGAAVSGVTSTGACGIIYAPMSVRTGTAAVAVTFSLNAFISQLALNDFVEIYISSSNSLETTTLVDIAWLTSGQ